MSRLSQQVCLITGAGGAIGLGIAKKFLQEGAIVCLCDLNKDALDSAEKELDSNARVLTSVVNVAKEESVRDWIAKCSEKFGGIDVLVNNAATFVFGTVEEVTEEKWDQVLSVNVKGYAFTTKYVVPELRKRGGGAIVNIASISSFVAQPSFVPYNTTKGAILQLTRCTAMDHGEDNIRVNAVCPGTIDTPATSKHAEKLGVTKEELTKDIVKDHFIKRLGTTEDVANAVLFLASKESSFISGATLCVDGGYTAH